MDCALLEFGGASTSLGCVEATLLDGKYGAFEDSCEGQEVPERPQEPSKEKEIIAQLMHMAGSKSMQKGQVAY